MKLPGGASAIVELSKLRDYCLNPQHPRGRHMARVFAAALGMTRSDAAVLRAALLRAARSSDALPGPQDEFGARYTIDFPVVHAGKQTTVRSGWIILRGEPWPRLVSCFVLLD